MCIYIYIYIYTYMYGGPRISRLGFLGRADPYSADRPLRRRTLCIYIYIYISTSSAASTPTYIVPRHEHWGDPHLPSLAEDRDVHSHWSWKRPGSTNVLERLEVRRSSSG